MNELKLSFPDGTSVVCPFGTRVETLVDRLGLPSREIAAVKVNNEILPITSRLEVSCRLEPVPLDSPEGSMIYRRSLSYMLAMAAWELYPARPLVVGHSLGNGYFYTFADEKPPLEEELTALSERMKEIARADLPIEYHYLSYEEALDLFERTGLQDSGMLLEQTNAPKVPVNVCRSYADLAVAPLVARSSLLTAFEIRAHENGFLLRYPPMGAGRTITPFEDSPRIFSVYKEYKKWGRIIGVKCVGQLNRLVSSGEIGSFVQIAEAFQQKKLAELADTIYQRRDSLKVILLAGPSSSGKTTTAKRLSIMLKVMGMDPVPIALDDYFLGRDLTPLDEKGEPDFECLGAVDVPYFNKQLVQLFNGEEVELPLFDFKIGARRESGKKLRMGKRTILVVEGIHGLNDELTPQIPRDSKFKLYVSALTQLNLDDHNRIPTSDNRLIRRMVRDYQFRNRSARDTIRMWPSVQRGERRHIFPFQDGADMAFNSALDYELAVLKIYAEPLLRSVKPTMTEYAEAARLLSFLDNFTPVPAAFVPGQSILREFIGDSDFKY